MHSYQTYVTGQQHPTFFGKCQPLSSRALTLLMEHGTDGNKVFQSEFIGVIRPGTSLIGLLEYNLLNSVVALFGYYFAAFTIDKSWMGRRRMQARTMWATKS